MHFIKTPVIMFHLAVVYFQEVSLNYLTLKLQSDGTMLVVKTKVNWFDLKN